MDPNKTSELLLSLIRKSQLNFVIEESPYSVSINLRKTFIQSKSGNPIICEESLEEFIENKHLQDALEKSESEQESLRKANHDISMKLEKAKKELSDAFEDINHGKKAVAALEEESLQVKLENKRLKEEAKCALKTIESKEIEADKLKNENKSLMEDLRKKENDLDKVCEENREVVKENRQNLKKLRKLGKLSSSVSTQTLVPPTHYPSTHPSIHSPTQPLLAPGSPTYSSAAQPLYSTNSTTTTCNISTSSTSADPSSSSIKYWPPNGQISAACQTDHSIDTPYKLNSPLPPIFSSTLFHNSPRISFLSNSLPRLDSICWGHISEEENLRDLAEEALSEHHDQQVKYFYETERERVKELKNTLND